VTLGVSVEVKILGKFSGATSVVYLGGIVCVCQPSSGIQVVSIAATPKLEVNRLNKDGLVRELQQRRLSVQGSVQELRERMCTFLKNLEHSCIGRDVDLAKVHFSQNIELSSIAKARDSILGCASDVENHLHGIFGAEWSGS